MDLQQVSQIFQIVTGVGTLFVLLMTLRLTRKITRESKRADVVMECNRRFDELWGLWTHYKPSELNDPRFYYRRFWSLQKDQYELFVQGFVSEDTFKYWMSSGHDEWAADRPLGELTFRKGWIEVQSEWSHSDFHEFMDRVFKGDIDNAVLDASRRARRPGRGANSRVGVRRRPAA